MIDSERLNQVNLAITMDALTHGRVGYNGARYKRLIRLERPAARCSEGQGLSVDSFRSRMLPRSSR